MSPPRDTGGTHGFGGTRAKRDANDYASLAPFLQRLNQHIVWRDEPRKDGKRAKVPYSPIDGKRTRAGDGYSVAPRFWATAPKAALTSVNYDGIGVVFGAIPGTDESIGGLDFDNCFEADGSLRPWAIPIFDILKVTYTERSPSLTGMKSFFRIKTALLDAILKVLGIATDKASCKATFIKKTDTEKAQQIELYLAGRYFTETGLRYAGSGSDVGLLDLETLARLGSLLPKADEDEKPTPKAHDAPASLEDLASAVAAIPVDIPIGDLDARDVWLRIMMGLHHETGGSDEGFAIVRDWSSKSPEFDEAGLRKQWNGLAPEHDNPTTAGTIFHLAAMFGWESARRVPTGVGTFAGTTLDELIDDVCLIIDADRWWSHKHRVVMAANALNTAVSGLRLPNLPWMGNNQPGTFIGWIKAKNLVRAYSCLVHRGGQPHICETAPGADDEAVNTWRPPPAIPDDILERVRREGDMAVDPWLTITSDVCNGDPVLIEAMLDWSAFVVMEPAIKPGYHWILRSRTQGIGKDMQLDGVCRALGPDNYVVINRDALESGFNPFIESRLVIVDELRRTTRGS